MINCTVWFGIDKVRPRFCNTPSPEYFNMHFTLIFSVLLTVASSLPFEPRQEQSLAPQLLSTINDLNTAVAGLTTAVNKFDGSLLGLLPQALGVAKAEVKLDFTILKATHTADKSAHFTAAESTNIVNALASGIGPIQASLDALKQKVTLVWQLKVSG